jgi:hypothetical protein
MEYASSNQGVGGSNPSGRTFHQNFFGSPTARGGHKRWVPTADDLAGFQPIEPWLKGRVVRLSEHGTSMAHCI